MATSCGCPWSSFYPALTRPPARRRRYLAHVSVLGAKPLCSYVHDEGGRTENKDSLPPPPPMFVWLEAGLWIRECVHDLYAERWV